MEKMSISRWQMRKNLDFFRQEIRKLCAPDNTYLRVIYSIAKSENSEQKRSLNHVYLTVPLHLLSVVLEKLAISNIVHPAFLDRALAAGIRKLNTTLTQHAGQGRLPGLPPIFYVLIIQEAGIPFIVYSLPIE